MAPLPRPQFRGPSSAPNLHRMITAARLDNLPAEVSAALASYERVVLDPAPAVAAPRTVADVLSDAGATIARNAAIAAIDLGAIDLASVARAQTEAARVEAVATALLWAREHAQTGLVSAVGKHVAGVMASSSAKHAMLVGQLAEIAQHLNPTITEAQALVSDAMRQDYMAAVGLIADLNKLHELAREIADDRARWPFGDRLEFCRTRAVGDVSRPGGGSTKWGDSASVSFWLTLARTVPIEDITLLSGKEQAALGAKLWPPRSEQAPTPEQHATRAYIGQAVSRAG